MCFIHTIRMIQQIWGPDSINRSIFFDATTFADLDLGIFCHSSLQILLIPVSLDGGPGSGRGTFAETSLRPSCIVSALCSGSCSCFFIIFQKPGGPGEIVSGHLVAQTGGTLQ